MKAALEHHLGKGCPEGVRRLILALGVISQRVIERDARFLLIANYPIAPWSDHWSDPIFVA